MSRRPLTKRSKISRSNKRAAYGCRSARAISLPLAALLTAGGVARGQVTEPEKKPRPSLPQYVPVSAPAFISVRSLAEIDEALTKANAGRLLSLMTGTTGAAQSVDFRAGIRTLLGQQTSVNIDEFSRTEVGLTAPSWKELGRAVWLVRLARPEQIDAWFPPERRSDAEVEGGDRLFRTQDGMMVAVHGSIAAIAPRKGDHQVVRDTFQLISRQRGESLADTREYRELASFLPAKPLAVAYVTNGVRGERAEMPPLFAEASLQRLMVGLYASEGRVDVAIRGALTQAARRAPLGPAALDRLMKLPATTLVAWASTINAQALHEAASGDTGNGVVSRYLALLEALRPRGEDDPGIFPSLGPHVIVAWDQDLIELTLVPQLALLVESREAIVLAEELEQIVDTLASVVPLDANVPAISYSTHFGVRLTHMPLGPFARASSFVFAEGLQQMELSWMAQGGWLIVSTSRAHLQRIIEAQFNLVPTLANVPDVQALRKRRSNLASLLVAQPDLAAEVLEEWLGGGHRRPVPWLEAGWWNEALANEGISGNRLGIGMSSEQVAGTVTVARVYASTPAAGRLSPGDRVVGIDGDLLDLASPNADLRRRWLLPGRPDGHVLRVQRGDTMIDVRVPMAPDAVGLSNLLVRPADAVREIAAVGRTMRFASWATHAADEAHYSALVSLRFGPVAQTARR